MALKVKTKKPTGLSISRNGSTFTLKWKKGDTDYNDGIGVQYRTNLHKKWITLSTSTKATSRAVSLTAENYYPTKDRKLQWIEMRVRGNRDTYKKNVKKKVKEKGKTVTKTVEVTYTPIVSDWAKKRYVIKVPRKPTVTATKSEQFSNVTTFNWSVNHDSKEARWYRGIEWQTRLVKNSNITDGSKIKWSSKKDGWGRGTSGSSKTITEDTVQLASGAYTRWLRVRSRGVRGSSAWAYAKHRYALPYRATISSAVATEKSSGGFQCKVVWKAPSEVSHPIDRTIVEYTIATPEYDLACPDDASWTEAVVVKDTKDKDAAVFPIDRLLSNDTCLYVRVNTEHDKVITYGVPFLAKGGIGKLTEPILSPVRLGDNYMVTVTAENRSSVEDSYLVILYRPASDPTSEIIIGTIEYGETTVNVQAPDWSGESAFAFGVYAAVGDIENLTYDTALMKSSIVWGTGDVPKAPTEVKVYPTNISGTIRVEWDWSWDKADGAELSWSDHEDAWESTDEPETYEVSNIHNSRWNISGLETGIKWYVRVRFYKGTDDMAYSPYSEIAEIDLTSAPSIPTLMLSESVITEEGDVTASWVYTTTDGTSQAYAEITTAEVNASGVYYGRYSLTEDTEVASGKKYFAEESGIYTLVTPTGNENPVNLGWYEIVPNIIAHTETAQHITINAKDAGWQVGNTYNLCVRVVSASGRVSDDWSSPVSVVVAEPLDIQITNTSLVTETETIPTDEEPVTREYLALKEMPLSLTVTGAGEGGTTTVAIERTYSYYLDRPDESSFTGYEGETVALYTQTGEDEIRISDLIGTLDDGATYTLVATVQDGLGQTASAELEFEVSWRHQAIIPDGTVEIDEENLIAKITPIAPVEYNEVEQPVAEELPTYYELVDEQYVLTEDQSIIEGKTYYTRATTIETDVCDIYRLSTDKPELIVEGGAFGTTYVDPYATIGQFGGYRLVTRTANGDYITPANQIAWLDLTEEKLEIDNTIIDYEGGRVSLYYNVDVSSSWNKDFTETKYLGGSVQGDWNPAVSRTSTISAVTLTIIDDNQIEAIRRLAVSPSICHVRTKDGSSYAADVQVSENHSHDKKGKVVSYTFSITRVDTEELDGMTLAEWNNIHGME